MAFSKTKNIIYWNSNSELIKWGVFNCFWRTRYREDRKLKKIMSNVLAAYSYSFLFQNISIVKYYVVNL